MRIVIGSTKVEVRLKNYGLDQIEIIDNGSGIDKSDYQFVVRVVDGFALSSQRDVTNLIVRFSHRHSSITLRSCVSSKT